MYLLNEGSSGLVGRRVKEMAWVRGTPRKGKWRHAGEDREAWRRARLCVGRSSQGHAEMQESQRHLNGGERYQGSSEKSAMGV